jgi:hypothetical protein
MDPNYVLLLVPGLRCADEAILDMPCCSYPELASVMDSHVMEAITFAKISSSGSLLHEKVNL